MGADSFVEFSDGSRRKITAEQVRLAEPRVDGVVRAFVAVDAGPDLVIDFDWHDLATLSAISNSLQKEGAGTLGTVMLVLDCLFASTIEQWQRMSYDARAVELISLDLPIVSHGPGNNREGPLRPGH